MPSCVPAPHTGAGKTLTSLANHWSGSLHLTMLASPLRRCIVTQKVLPTSLLVQLKPVTLPSPSTRTVMLPNQILHPKYAPTRFGKSVWFTCDARIFAKLEERGGWKVVNAKAGMGKGMGGLIWTQLGERCVQEVEVLRGRFAGRKRLDLFGAQEGAERSFAIRLEAQTAALARDNGSMPTFEPRFKDPDQAERFRIAIQALMATATEDNAKVYYAKHSHITAPLGVALYRLNLWCSNGAPTTTAP